MKPFPFRGAIFDLDGTLFDSMHVWTEVDNAFLRKRGIPMPSDYHDEVKSRNFPEAKEVCRDYRLALGREQAAIAQRRGMTLKSCAEGE